MTIDLLPYQRTASDQIANRFQKLLADPMRPYERANIPVPYYQALSAITGAGKTPILADAVAQMRGLLPLEPLVMWISKGKVVVDQTYTNFEPGGKYEKLVEGFKICYLSEVNREKAKDGATAWIIMSTAASFSDEDKTNRLRAHRINEDADEEPLWTILTERIADAGVRRPLVIVYDEGHNLTDLQTDLLMELEPDAIIVASATMATPGRLGRVIDRLEQSGWDKRPLDDDEGVKSSLVTAVRSSSVVDAGLIKRQIILSGYHTEMETCLDDLLEEMETVRKKAEEHCTTFRPKAIYVCRTNISQDDGSLDNHLRPFNERKAPPILIWRHLVQQKRVDPASVAVYCAVKFDQKNYPHPVEFIHFAGGENDYSRFTAGNYTHVIFNLSLQEGWDDPSCCFAYIDKSMGSTVQIEQVIGRALRQPEARHFPDPDLNTASFYVRVDNKQDFPLILDSVSRRLRSEIPEVSLTGFSDAYDRKRSRLAPKEARVVPEIHIDSGAAVEPIDDAIDGMRDYRADTTGTIGKGEVRRARQEIGRNTPSTQEVIEKEHSNRVTARWVLRRAIQKLHPEPVKAIDWADSRLDATVEITSTAATELRNLAEQLVDVWLNYSDLTFEGSNPFPVGPVFARPDTITLFTNALHDGYSDLNGDEIEMAREVDKTGLPWVRNPPNGGYSIPLLTRGDTRNFFPDFLVWKGDVIYALDPKSKILIGTDAWRKLLDISDEKGVRKVAVRLVSRGKWSNRTFQREGDSGFTVWSCGKGGTIHAKHCHNMPKAVELCLK